MSSARNWQPYEDAKQQPSAHTDSETVTTPKKASRTAADVNTPPAARSTQPHHLSPQGTPLSALKMLSRVAGNEIENLMSSRRESLSSLPPTTPKTPKEAPSRPSTASKSTGRKENALSVICTNFVRMCRDRVGQDLSIDVCAHELGIGRRRIYDVVNVLEALEIICRKAKNTYLWNGFENLALSLAKIKQCSYLIDSPTKTSSVCSSPSEQDSPTGSNAVDEESGVRKERTLGVLAQRFIMMFIMAEKHVVSLEEAADRLVFGPDCPEAKKSKTKMRRLYDIVNILGSLQLIERHDRPEERKDTAYVWAGPDLGSLPVVPDSDIKLTTHEGGRTRKQSLFQNSLELNGLGPRPKRRRRSARKLDVDLASSAHQTNLPFQFPREYTETNTGGASQISVSNTTTADVTPCRGSFVLLEPSKPNQAQASAGFDHSPNMIFHNPVTIPVEAIDPERFRFISSRAPTTFVSASGVYGSWKTAAPPFAAFHPAPPAHQP